MYIYIYIYIIYIYTDLLSKCKKEIDNTIYLVLPYHLAQTKVYEILERHTDIHSNLNV